MLADNIADVNLAIAPVLGQTTVTQPDNWRTYTYFVHFQVATNKRFFTRTIRSNPGVCALESDNMAARTLLVISESFRLMVAKYLVDQRRSFPLKYILWYITKSLPVYTPRQTSHGMIQSWGFKYTQYS